LNIDAMMAWVGGKQFHFNSNYSGLGWPRPGAVMRKWVLWHFVVFLYG